MALLSLTLIAMIGTLITSDSEEYKSAEEIVTSNEKPAVLPKIDVRPSERIRIQYREPDLPVRVDVPSLNIDARVIPVGLNAKRGVDVPEDINIVGWYELGVSPQHQFGSAAFVGHRDGQGGAAGVFLNIGELQVGETVTVTNRDGREISYRVSRVELVSKERFPIEAERFFAESGPARLTLITCGGSYDRSRGGYQANIVVTSTPISY